MCLQTVSADFVRTDVCGLIEAPKEKKKTKEEDQRRRQKKKAKAGQKTRGRPGRPPCSLFVLIQVHALHCRRAR